MNSIATAHTNVKAMYALIQLHSDELIELNEWFLKTD